MVQPLGTVAHSQPQPQLPEPPRGEPLTRGQDDLARLDSAMDFAHTLEIVRVAVVVGAVPVEYARVGAFVDLGRPTSERRQAATDERLAERLREHREVCEHAEAAEALSQDGPTFDVERLSDELSIADDRVRAEVGQIGR